ncbi:MAG: tetratricopeptide repeat protein [Candidatus Omnitrophica bacterium]|nr:tetratricopeptide repeat protein [Candidatus Omnitrophota bacterium]
MMKKNIIIHVVLLLIAMSVNAYAQGKTEAADLPSIADHKVKAQASIEAASVKNEEEISSEQVAMLMEQINDNMNTLNVELDLTRQAYDYLLKEYDGLKNKQGETLKNIEQLKFKNEKVLNDNKIDQVKLQDSKRELKEKEWQIKILRKDMKDRLHELEKVNKEKETILAESQDYVLRLREKDAKLQVSQEQIELLQSEIAKQGKPFEQDLAASMDLANKLEDEKKGLLKENQEYSFKIKTTLAQLKASEVQLTARADQIKALQYIESQGGILKNELVDARVRINEIEKENKKISKDNKSLEKKTAAYEQQIEAKEEEIKILSSNAKTQDKLLTKKLAVAENNIAEFKKQVKEILKESKKDKEQLRNSKKIIAQNDEKIQQSENMQGQLFEVNEQNMKAVKEEIDFLKNELNKRNEFLKVSKEELAKHKTAAYQLLDEKEKLENSLQEIRRQATNTQKDLKLAKKLLREKEKEYTLSLENNRKGLNKQLSEFQELVRDLENKNVLVNKDKEVYLAQIQSLKNISGELEKKLTDMKAQKNVLAKEIKIVSSREIRIKAKGKKQEKLLTSYSEHIDKLMVQAEDLEEKNRHINFLLKTMPEKMSHLEKELSQLRIQNSGLHYNLGVFHTQRQEYIQAIMEFEQALKFNSQDASTHYNLGIIYSRYIIDEVKAITHFKHYLAIAPDDKDSQKAKEYILIWGAKEVVN